MKSAIKLEDIIENSLQNNIPYASLIDIDTMFGTLEFYNLCIKNNLKPIIGLQIDFFNDTIILIANNNNGLKNLYQISYYSSKNEQDKIYELLKELIVISYKNKNNEKLKNNCFRFYVKEELAIKENFCIKEEDYEIVKILYAIKNSLTLEEISDDIIPKTPHFYTKEQFEDIYSKTQKDNLNELVKMVNISISQKDAMNFPIFSTNASFDLKNLCLQKLNIINKNNDPVYAKRLEYELSVIDKMGFSNYFLVVQDYIKWARKNDIYIGPGRGSVGGCFVAYLLNITKIDPIKNNLIFERFLNIERNDMPDIDVDVEDSRRNEVINYLFEKYSNENVGYIITFQRMKSKMALTDIGRILKIGLPIIKNITSLFTIQIEDSNLEKAIEQSEKIKKESLSFSQLFSLAQKIVNFPRNTGLHAAGIVICGSPLNNIVPTLCVENNKTLIQYEGNVLEKLGLVKMDVLGLSNLTIIKNVVNLIQKTKNISIDLDDIEKDNSDVFSQISSGDTVGIFQLESDGMIKTVMKVKPKNLEDLSVVLALYRPGAVENMKLYLENKKNPQEIKYINDSFKKVLSSTYNVPIYQEQIIELIKITANYTYGKADIFRRIISKKKIEELKKYKAQFFEDALLNNYSKEQIENIYSYLEKFTGYGFNHSHSLCYALLSYEMAYLKFYYPLEFITVLLSYSGGNEKVNEYINEAKKMNIEVLKPSILHSTTDFSIYEGKILFGFAQIKGLGSVMSEKIIQAQKKIIKNDLYSIFNILVNNSITQSTIEILVYAGAFDEIEPNKKFILSNLEEIINKTKTLLKDGTFLFSPNLVPQEVNEEDIKIYAKKQIELIGYDFTKYKTDDFFLKERMKDASLKSLIFINNAEDASFKTIAKISSSRITTTKYGAKMCFLSVYDETASIKLILWPPVYAKYGSLLEDAKTHIFSLKKAGNTITVENVS